MADAPPANDPAFAAAAALQAAKALMIAATVTLLAALLLSLRTKSRWPACGLLFLAIASAVGFAVGHRVNSDAPDPIPQRYAAAFSALKPDQRVLLTNIIWAEAGASTGFDNIAGYNPLVLARTARFLAAVQNENPDQVAFGYSVRRPTAAYRMLRCAMVISGPTDGPIYATAGALPRLVLAGQVIAAADAPAALADVLSDDFNPARQVVLESNVSSIPTAPGANENPGSVRLDSETTDKLEIEADLPVPRVLVVTDAYSSGWKAVALAGSVQPRYEVLPADYCLRGIPLSAGHHHFVLEYRPTAYVAGGWVSLAALGTYVAALGLMWLTRGSLAAASEERSR